MKNTGFIEDQTRANCLPARLILPTWFDHLEKRFSYIEVQFKNFCLHVKPSNLPAENINEASDNNIAMYGNTVTVKIFKTFFIWLVFVADIKHTLIG